MKKRYKILVALLILYCLFAGYTYYAYKTSLSSKDWYIKSLNESEIVWADFIWTNRTIGGKTYKKTAMFIPAKMVGIENDLTFQFDTGANISMIYENKLSSFYVRNDQLKNKVRKMKFPINQLYPNKKVFQNAQITFWKYTISNKRAFVKPNFGNKVSEEKVNAKDTIHLGTLGADILRNKVLIIDYPKQKFAICDEVPEGFNDVLIDIELNSNGQPVLPLRMNSKKYRLLFDTGSSLFPITASSENIEKFSKNPIMDSLEISSWGKKHVVHSRIITDTFEIANKKYSAIAVYENHTGHGIDDTTDGMMGNALFWNNTIIIDFKNKKFGVK